jgi:hypothetical protein
MLYKDFEKAFHRLMSENKGNIKFTKNGHLFELAKAELKIRDGKPSATWWNEEKTDGTEVIFSQGKDGVVMSKWFDVMVVDLK